MNWLGKLVQKEIGKNDTVLDLGCGIYNDIEGLKCKSILGVDIVNAYIEIASKKYPTIRLDLTNIRQNFVMNSFDVVLALDVIEHLNYNKAIDLINDMKLISRKKVIIYTPFAFKRNQENIMNTWGIKGNFTTQEHLCYISPEYLKSKHFRISFPEPDKNTLGVYEV